MLKLGDLRISINRKGIKHLYLRVDASSKRVLVSAPLKATDEEILRLVEEKEEWIRKRLEESSKREEKPFLIFGQETLILYEVGGESSFKEGLLTLGIKEDSSMEKEKKKERFLKKLLKEKAIELLLEIEEEKGLKAGPITIKKMKTRWGSINRRTGAMSLNLHLIHKEEWVIKSVLYHELAHLKIPGHQKDFYEYLSTLDPNYKKVKKEL